MITPGQRSMLFAEFNKAAQALGLDRTEAEAYRRRAMEEEAGVASSRDITRQAQFDAILRRFRLDAGDYEGAAQFDTSGCAALAYVARVMAEQIIQLKGEGEWPQNAAKSKKELAADYLEGIFSQAGWKGAVAYGGDNWYLDMTSKQVRWVIAILDKYRRRQLKRLAGEGANAKGMLAFSDRWRYEVDGPILRRVGVDRDYYARENLVRAVVS